MDVHDKFLLANYKAISRDMTVRASGGHETLPIPFELGSQTGNYPPPAQHIFATCIPSCSHTLVTHCVLC